MSTIHSALGAAVRDALNEQDPEKLKPKFHEPRRNEGCVCGSGKKFKKCCAGKYSAGDFSLYRKAFSSGDYVAALAYARRHFTWYALCYKAHTVPFLKVDFFGAQKLLTTDIEAMADILERVHRCYSRLKIGAEFHLVIDRVSHLIDDPRWREKIAYARAWCNLIDMNDEIAAFNELHLIDIKECKNPEILALYFQVNQKPWSLTESLAILDRILENTDDEAWKLKYSFAKGARYLLVCQFEDGSKIIEAALSRFSLLDQEEKSDYGLYEYAHALQIYGSVTRQPALVEEAVDLVKGLIGKAETEGESALYVADLYRLLGECEAVLCNHGAAVEYLRKSFDLKPAKAVKIFLARAICNSGDADSARAMLLTLSANDLDKAGRYDFAISWAYLAASSRSDSDLTCAKNYLRIVQVDDPMFAQQRDHWLIRLLQIEPKSEPGGFKQWLHLLNQYVTLNPNIAGIGVDFNRMISDYLKKQDDPMLGMLPDNL